MNQFWIRVGYAQKLKPAAALLPPASSPAAALLRRAPKPVLLAVDPTPASFPASLAASSTATAVPLSRPLFAENRKEEENSRKEMREDDENKRRDHHGLVCKGKTRNEGGLKSQPRK